MKISYFLIFLFFGMTVSVNAQSDLIVLVVDSVSYRPVHRAKIVINGQEIKKPTNVKGVKRLEEIPNGIQMIKISHPFYHSKEIELNFPVDLEVYTIVLSPIKPEIKDLVIEVTRSKKTIDDLPTKVEVLSDRIEPTGSKDPSTLGHVFRPFSGMRMQTSTVSSGGATLRMRGLEGRHTQILRDGFPLYGGFSGTMDLAHIPLLDLRQIEYVKGSTSSLYGNGAVGGVVNLVSKRPEYNEILLHENLSTIGARDFNAYVSKDFGKLGFTSLASLYMHVPFDADKDGYSDMPELVKIQFSPKFFYYPTPKTEIYLGAIISNDNRIGGDMNLIDNFHADTTHFFFDAQLSRRLSSQFKAEHQFGEFQTLKLKNSVSSFRRTIQIRANKVGDRIDFGGDELNSYTELNYNLVKPVHDFNAGISVYTNSFKEHDLDSISLRSQQFSTYGGYLSYLWDVNHSVALESSVRLDYVIAESNVSKSAGEFFFVPKINALFKLGKVLSIRLGGGMGYQMPTMFNRESELLAYQNIKAIDFNSVRAERSYNGTVDFTFNTDFNTKNIHLEFNQSFFYNNVENPIHLKSDTSGVYEYLNVFDNLTSAGFESQLDFKFWKFQLMAGYTYVDAYVMEGSSQDYLSLTPKHQLNGELAFVDYKKWRISCDMAYNTEQKIENGFSAPSYFVLGFTAERSLGSFGIFANFENVTNVRQSNYESLLTGPDNTTQTTTVWGPLDGFFFNWGVKIIL